MDVSAARGYEVDTGRTYVPYALEHWHTSTSTRDSARIFSKLAYVQPRRLSALTIAQQSYSLDG